MTDTELKALDYLVARTPFIQEVFAARGPITQEDALKCAGWEACIEHIIGMTQPVAADPTTGPTYVAVDAH